MKFRDRIARFMSGRNGTDELARFSLIVTLIFVLLSTFIKVQTVSAILWVLALAGLVWCYYRMLSRSIYKRRRENDWYLRQRAAVKKWFRSLKDRWQQRGEYKFFRCPGCRTLLRVPRGKGKILLTCRKCGRRFERKT